MILLSAPAHVVAIYGVGLIGSAIHRALTDTGRWREANYPIRWRDRQRVETDLDTIFCALRDHITDDVARVSVVWSAGVCGFGASEIEIAPELSVYRRILESLRPIAKRDDLVLELLLISSLGGLFEGRRRVEPDMQPHPHQPYGWFKLQQEQDLDSVDFPLFKRIYRVSSAYGRIQSGHRLGLVSNLIHNGVHRRVTQVVGRISALRDFVFADDIGHYLADVMQQSREPDYSTPQILAVGKPSSIFEVRALVETMLRRRLLIAFQSQSVNDSDITVSKRTMPTDWYPHGLTHGLRCVYEDYLSRGTPMAR